MDASLVIDGILALVLVEFVALVVWRARTGRGIAPLDLVANLAAGGFLLLAARAALRSDQAQMLGWLAAAGLAHLADLVRRWR